MEKGVAGRVRRSLGALTILKPLSAVLGLVVLVVLSRTLSPSEYGAYFSALAISEIAMLVSNFGLIHAAYRYVHAVEGDDGKLIPYGPLEIFLIARLGTLVLAITVGALICSLMPSQLINRFVAPSVLCFVAIIIVGEGVSRYVEVLFESMLSQYRSQFTVLLRSIIRVAGNILLLVYGIATLESVLLVECVAASSSSVVAVVMLRGVVVGAISAGHAREWRIDRPFVQQALRFVFPAYGAQLVGVSYGPDVLKLVLGWMSGTAQVALFGFCYSIASVVQRYMPANLMAGIFRPAFVAAGKRCNRAEVLNSLFGVLVKINWLFIFAVIAAVAPVSNDLTMTISDGNYEQAGWILVLLICSLIFVSSHLIQSNVSVAVENSNYSLIATIVVAGTLPLALVLASGWGALGLSWYCLLTELVWVSAFRYLITKDGWAMDFDLSGSAKLIVSGAFAVGFGWLVAGFGGHWIVTSVLSSMLFIAATLRNGTFNDKDRMWLKMVLPARLARVVG